MKKYIKNTLFLSLAMLAFASCSEDTMDAINNNKNNPKNVEAKFLVADLTTSTAFNVVGGNLSLYASIYIEHEAGIENQMYYAEKRQGEPSSTSTYNDMWGSAYGNIMKAKVIIEKCSAGGQEEGSDITLGIAKVLLTYNAAILTDLFGDVPYFQAGIIDNTGLPVYMQPKVDKQELIYADILKQLDEAIVLFDGADKGLFGAVGSKDLFYGGKGESWKKAAYALKARYTMRLLAKSSSQSADLQNILFYVDQSFASAKEELKFDKYNGASLINPLAAYSNSRAGMASSQSLVNKLIEREDPRASQAFMKYIKDGDDEYYIDATDPSLISAAPNGTPKEKIFNYDAAKIDYAAAAPTLVMSYHELLFLKAEAYARLGNPLAKESLKAAIVAGFANLENSIVSAADYLGVSESDLSEAVAEAYFTANVEPLFDVNPIKEISVQKYLSFFGASGESIEAYSDYRRFQAMGEDNIKLENPLNTGTEKRFPLRFTYAASDVVANMEVKALTGDGYYVYSEKVWWAGGTR